MSIPDLTTGAEQGKETRTMLDLPPQEKLDHAWRYFALHAGQRMSMFNYFLVLFGLAAAGLGGSLRAEGALRLAGGALGLTLTAISYTFYKLDQRTSFLCKHTERILRDLESSIPETRARVFVNEADDTVYAQAISGLWTYGKAFRLVFLVAGIVGLGGAGLAGALFGGLLR
jgi:hypothetical protein